MNSSSIGSGNGVSPVRRQAIINHCHVTMISLKWQVRFHDICDGWQFTVCLLNCFHYTLLIYKTKIIKYYQWNCWWWPGATRTYDIGRTGIGLVRLKYSGVSKFENVADLLSVGPLWANLSEIIIKIRSEAFHSWKYIWKCRLPKWRPFCLGGDELMDLCDSFAASFKLDMLNVSMTKLKAIEQFSIIHHSIISSIW